MILISGLKIFNYKIIKYIAVLYLLDKLRFIFVRHCNNDFIVYLCIRFNEKTAVRQW